MERPNSGGDLARRLNSFQTIAMDVDIEGGDMGPYAGRPRTFPNMRSKPYTPLPFRLLMRINVRVLLALLLVGLGAMFYIGASTSPVIVFVFTVCIISFLVSVYLTKWVLAKDEGPPEMVEGAGALPSVLVIILLGYMILRISVSHSIIKLLGLHYGFFPLGQLKWNELSTWKLSVSVMTSMLGIHQFFKAIQSLDSAVSLKALDELRSAGHPIPESLKRTRVKSQLTSKQLRLHIH